MKPQTTIRLAQDCPNVVAIKEASGSLEQVDEIIKGKPAHFEVISGDDALTLPDDCLWCCGSDFRYRKRSAERVLTHDTL